MTEDIDLSRRPPLRSVTGLQILGTGSFVPDKVVKNEDLVELGYNAEWIFQRSGIYERRHAPVEIATSDLAVQAAARCICSAGVDKSEIDLVIVGTYTPDMPVPAVAMIVQDKLGLCAAAMDVHAACAGFVYSLVTAAQFVVAGGSKMALVIGADCNSRIVNPKDKLTYPLFGDGAGAVLLGPGSNEQGLISYSLGSDGSGAELLCCPMGGSRMPSTPEGIQENLHFLRMDGLPVFKWAVRLLKISVIDVLAHAGLSIDQIDLWVPHQANLRIIHSLVDTLGIDREKVLINIDRYGNTSAGSIPLALDEAYQQGLIKRGDRLVICGFGAGLVWGTAIFQW